MSHYFFLLAKVCRVVYICRVGDVASSAVSDREMAIAGRRSGTVAWQTQQPLGDLQTKNASDDPGRQKGCRSATRATRTDREARNRQHQTAQISTYDRDPTNLSGFPCRHQPPGLGRSRQPMAIARQEQRPSLEHLLHPGDIKLLIASRPAVSLCRSLKPSSCFQCF